MNGLTILEPAAQDPLADPPYDKWVNPAGKVSAEFHRRKFGYLIRFKGQVDFEIDLASGEVRATPASPEEVESAHSLYHNSILPILGNHRGELHMHGSAVRIDDRAVAFMGLSRRGKTTLAGSFAKAGYPFLTEDVLSLEKRGSVYHVQPSRPVLRLFGDSAMHIFAGDPAIADAGDAPKSEFAAGTAIPFSMQSAPLAGIFILGPGESKAVSLTRIGQAEALTQLVQHAFILDVEDRTRLRGHFDRIADLAEQVQCYELDYPRRYEQLDQVITAIVEDIRESRIESGND